MTARGKAAFAILAMLGLAPTSAFALPDEETERASPLEQAREESSVQVHPRERFALPAGTLRLSEPELLASTRQRLELSVTLERDVAAGTLELTLPRLWVSRADASGLPFARVPATGSGVTGRARARRSERVVSFDFDGGHAGDVARFTIRDAGIPAGTYRLPYRWREPGAAPSDGTAAVIFYAPTRETQMTPGAAWSRLATPGVEVNATDDAPTESETFLSVVPGNRERFVVGANGGGGFNAWVTNDGGQSFTRAPMPTATDVPGEAGPETSQLCCDPMSAADAAGNLWYGGLSRANGGGQPSRIVVNRIAPGATSFQSFTVGLTQRTPGTQDKPMMTIDNSPTSPHFGRLYVIWDEPSGGGVNVVISQCDTRPGGIPNAANCDNADNWSTPVSVTPDTGSYIYADVAASPDGTVNVVWWDYSATNAIRGDTCGPGANCAAAASWGTPQTIATLDATGDEPVPFACPIVAQPGGRASPSPQVDVDRSGGANNGRVYVSWGDLRAGSGTTRCAKSTAPAATHLSWDSFVASAAGGLPGSANPSAAVGTRLLTDGEGGGQTSSDEWFPWLAVDQTTGQAWADFYSTRDDAARRTTNFYVRSVTPGGGGHALGPRTRVSGAASDYSTEQCCLFGNDYGDYTGIDATEGVALPVWSDRRTGSDGEAYMSVLAQATLVATNPASPAADTTPLVLGHAPAGSTVSLYTGTLCTGAPAATGSAADLASPGVEVPVPSGATSEIRATATLGGITSSCSEPLSYTATAAPATEPTPSTTTPTSPSTPTSTPDTSVTLSLGARAVQLALRNGGLRARVSCPFEACHVSARGRVRVPSAQPGGRAKRIATRPAAKALSSGQRATLTLRFSSSLRRQIARALRSRRTRGRVRAVVRVTATDAAGNRQTKSAAVRIRR